MSKYNYEVELIPHVSYLGLPCDPSITVTIKKITTKWGFPVDSKQVFDTYDRDLFKCVSECNNYFAQNNVNEKDVRWPDFCRYIKTYKE